MVEKVTELIQELVKKEPSAEVFKIQSLDGKKIMTTSLDGKCASSETCYKKEGFIVLFSNY